MDLGLRGKRALITGGSKGIGLAIARSLVAEGASVGLVARDPVTLAEAASELARPGVDVAVAPADVTDAEALGAAVTTLAGHLGGLDLLVANAGGTVGSGNLASAGPGDFTATFALNAGHAAELIRFGLPHLRAAGGGSVVVISSVTGMRPAPRTAYAAAKAAEIHLAATAAQELAPMGIRVNAVSPGSLGQVQARQPRCLRGLAGERVPARQAGPPGRSRRRRDVPAVRSRVVGHRGQCHGGRGADLPERPPL